MIRPIKGIRNIARETAIPPVSVLFHCLIAKKAIKEIAAKCDIFLIVGSTNSSNSNRLREVAEASSKIDAYLVNSAAEVKAEWFVGKESAGLSAGASTPEDIVFGVVDYLKEHCGVENISEIITTINHKNLLGIILSCVSPENYEQNITELKSLGVPFGFKLNGFVTTNPDKGYTNNFNKSKTGNPNEFLGHREDLIPEKMALIVKKFKEAGATILGGCCETRPAHIKEISKLK